MFWLSGLLAAPVEESECLWCWNSRHMLSAADYPIVYYKNKYNQELALWFISKMVSFFLLSAPVWAFKPPFIVSTDSTAYQETTCDPLPVCADGCFDSG